MPTNNLGKRINATLDRLVRPSIWLFHHQRRLFRLCGFGGLAAAIALSIVITLAQNQPVWVMIVLILSSIASFFAIALLRKILTGREALTYFHHEIGVIVSAWIVLRLLNQPILPFLNATVLGVGAFLAFGRVGCLMAGCCHGRPYRWGVCYHEEYLQTGFPTYLANVRLFPIQLVESVGVFIIVVLGTISILALPLGRPGSAFVWYVIMYDIGRFFIEFARGDAQRPYYRGLSENQWVSVTLTGIVVFAGLAGWLPFELWHAAAFALLLGTVISIVLWSSQSTGNWFQLVQATHVKELALLLADLRQEAADVSLAGNMMRHVPIRQTSQGLRISLTRVFEPQRGELSLQCALSRVNAPLPPTSAYVLMKLIQQLTPNATQVEIIAEGHNIYHFSLPVLSKNCIQKPG